MPLPVALGDQLEFKLVSVYDGKVECNNIFHYLVTEASVLATMDNYGAGLWEKIGGLLTAIVSNVMVFSRIDVRSLDANGLPINGESYLIGTGVQGSISASEALPPFVTWTFKYVRPDSAHRHGFKRFAGLTEDKVAKGLPSGTTITALNALAAVLESDFNAYTIDGVTGLPDAAITGSQATPRLVQRVINGDLIQPVNYYDITGVVFDKIGSQNSRKFNVGS